MLPELFGHAWAWLAPFSLLIQIALCVHVYKTGRPYWWMWIILMASFVGALVYVLVEILPELRFASRRSGGRAWFVPQSVVIRRAREELEEGYTIQRCLTLAGLLFDQGKREEAEAVAAEAVGGAFKTDPEVISEVAWYKVEAGKYDEAQRLLDNAAGKIQKTTALKMQLLRGRILLGRRQYKPALELFTGLMAESLGEEPRYYQALCHAGLGNRTQAVALLQDIAKAYRKGNAIWRRAEKPWYQSAKRKLQELTATPARGR